MPITDLQAEMNQLEREVRQKINSDYPNQARDISLHADQELGFPPGSGNGRVYIDLIDENNKRLGSVFDARDVDRVLRRFKR